MAKILAEKNVNMAWESVLFITWVELVVWLQNLVFLNAK